MCLGIPGEIVEVREADRLRVGRVRLAGITREVCLDYGRAQPRSVVSPR